MCETISEMEGSEGAEENMECPSGAGDHRECTLRNLSLFSCYKIWLEVEGGRGKVRSFPVYVAPIDYGEFQSFFQQHSIWKSIWKWQYSVDLIISKYN